MSYILYGDTCVMLGCVLECGKKYSRVQHRAIDLNHQSFQHNNVNNLVDSISIIVVVEVII